MLKYRTILLTARTKNDIDMYLNFVIDSFLIKKKCDFFNTVQMLKQLMGSIKIKWY